MKNLISIAATAVCAATFGWAGEPTAYKVGGQHFEGYLAAAETPRGTVVLLPTWNGLSDYEKDRAEMLADMGFTTFAADLYPAGTHPATMEERETSLQAVVTDQDRMHEIVTAAVDQARQNGNEPLILMGYSMGAIIAMETAWSGLGNDMGVGAYVIFSGRVSDNFGRMMPDDVAPFFVAHGEADTMVQVSGLVNFVDDVELSGSSAIVQTYPGAGHLFSAFGFPNYDEAADQHSWAELSAFLAKLAG